MKKLLALVLCVMMFVSVLSTTAFADQHQPAPTYDSTAKWGSLNVANKAISDTKKNIEYLYGGLAADNAVFGTIQAMDSVVVDMVKGLLADVDDFERDYYVNGVKVGTEYITHDALEKNAKAVLRNVIGGEVSNYMNSHLGNYTEIKSHLEIRNGNNWYELQYIGYDGNGNPIYYDASNGSIWGYQDSDKTWYEHNTTGLANAQKIVKEKVPNLAGWTGRETADADGNFVWFKTVQDFHYDPMKYADTFATAVTKALSSEKGVANLQRYAYGLMQLKVAESVKDDLDDLADAIAKWEDGTAILDQYGFADFDFKGNLSADPYAFIDPTNIPNPSTTAILNSILAGNETNYVVYDFPATAPQVVPAP